MKIIQTEETLLNCIYGASITCILIPGGHNWKRAPQTNILDKIDAKNSQCNTWKLNTDKYQEDLPPWPGWLYPRDLGMVQCIYVSWII